MSSSSGVVTLANRAERAEGSDSPMQFDRVRGVVHASPTSPPRTSVNHESSQPSFSTSQHEDGAANDQLESGDPKPIHEFIHDCDKTK